MADWNTFDNPEFFFRYIRLRNSPVSQNELIERPSMYSLLPRLSGLSVLDLGCGLGDFCNYAAANGARSVTGIDKSRRMITLASQRNAVKRVQYVCADLEQWPFPGGRFDLVFSSLTLHYIRDLSGLLKRLRPSLAEGGHLLLSVEHPVMTAQAQGWELDAKGVKSAWRLTHYGMEGERIVEWLGVELRKFHRKFETYVRLLRNSGFQVLCVREPQPTPKVLAQNSALAYEMMRPPYLVMLTKVKA